MCKIKMLGRSLAAFSLAGALFGCEVAQEPSANMEAVSSPSLEPVSEPAPKASAKINPDYVEILRLGGELAALAKTEGPQAAKAPFANALPMAPYRELFTDFSVETKTRATNIDANGGPHDLACIFRGMSADAMRKLQGLETAKTRGEQAQAWADADYLFSDVSAVLLPGDAGKLSANSYGGETCSADSTLD
jgi:hypothetical protein